MLYLSLIINKNKLIIKINIYNMYYIGHTKPDTDSVCAAIAAANLYNGTPVTAGPINKETEFVLNYFDVTIPEFLEDISGKEICIIDHNQTTQAPKGYENAKIKRIIDHHALQNSTFAIEEPIDIEMKPWGSSSTIVANLYLREGVSIDKKMAGIMLASILSDTLCFQSPTTTSKDKEIADILKPIAQIDDYKEFCKEMFGAKSNIGSLSTKEILYLDSKDFTMGEKSVIIGVAETVTPEMLIDRKEEFINEMKIQIQDKKVDYSFFFIIDVLNQQSTAIVCDDNHKEIIIKVFSSTDNENLLDIGNNISRKKQIAPALDEFLKINKGFNYKK